MRYVEHRPAAPLARHVACIWTLHAPAGEASGADFVVPDGCAELVLHHGDPFLREEAGGRLAVQPRAMVAGQITAPLRLARSGRAAVVGVRFLPGGAAPLLRERMSALTNLTPPLDAFVGPAAARLLERIHDAPDDGARVAIVEDWLLERLAAAPAALAMPGRAAIAAARIRSTAGRVRIDALAASLGVSGRHLERIFLERVGVTPKLLARIARFQAVFQRLAAAKEPSWATIAADCGYADQAHLVRDFRAFAGTTPSRWLAAAHGIADCFVARP